jgi:hypothetical protein
MLRQLIFLLLWWSKSPIRKDIPDILFHKFIVWVILLSHCKVNFLGYPFLWGSHGCKVDPSCKKGHMREPFSPVRKGVEKNYSIQIVELHLDILKYKPNGDDAQSPGYFCSLCSVCRLLMGNLRPISLKKCRPSCVSFLHAQNPWRHKNYEWNGPGTMCSPGATGDLVQKLLVVCPSSLGRT